MLFVMSGNNYAAAATVAHSRIFSDNTLLRSDSIQKIGKVIYKDDKIEISAKTRTVLLHHERARVTQSFRRQAPSRSLLDERSWTKTYSSASLGKRDK